MISLNSNYAAQVNVEGMRRNEVTLSRAMEHVATGKQLNRGIDDPAGMATSSLRTAQIRGMDVALENTQDGIAFVEAGFSGMQHIGQLMQRMRELAVRAGNAATLSAAESSRLDDEFQALTAEIDRTAKTTGAFSGPSEGQTPNYWPSQGTLDLIYVMDTTGSMGGFINNVRTQLSTFITTLETNKIDWSIGVVDYRDENPLSDPAARAAILTPLSSNQAAVQATLNALSAGGGGDLAESGLEAVTLALTSAWRYAAGTADYERHMIMVTDVPGPNVNHDNVAGGFAGDGRSAMDTVTVANAVAAAGVALHVAGDVNAVQNQTLANTTGGQLGSINNFANVLTSIQNAVMPNAVASAALRTRNIQVGPNVTDGLQFTFQDCRAASLGASGLSITSAGGAAAAITALDGALDTLSNYEQQYGAMSARLQSIKDGLFTARNNEIAANSRIVDSDMASEVASLTSGAIRAQTSAFMSVNIGKESMRALDVLNYSGVRAEGVLMK